MSVCLNPAPEIPVKGVTHCTQWDQKLSYLNVYSQTKYCFQVWGSVLNKQKTALSGNIHERTQTMYSNQYSRASKNTQEIINLWRHEPTGWKYLLRGYYSNWFTTAELNTDPLLSSPTTGINAPTLNMPSTLTLQYCNIQIYWSIDRVQHYCITKKAADRKPAEQRVNKYTKKGTWREIQQKTGNTEQEVGSSRK